MFKLFGGSESSNEKVIKRLLPIVDKINALEPDFEALSDEELRSKTNDFKSRIQNGATLDELLPEAFAAVREAARRVLTKDKNKEFRIFDVQMMGGIILHQGKIAEMKTGEGKTAVATLPLYLNSLTGKGCHLVTVNDYLARRDLYWMGPVFHALGVSVASIYPMQKSDELSPSLLFDPSYDSGIENDVWKHFRPISRREAYNADITYGTSSEFGFDYLRDNMAIDPERYVQRPLSYAIVDEVDNLLIDEARTPLIISAPDMEAGQKYQIFARLIQRLTPEVDYEVKLKERSAELTDEGFAKMEKLIMREGLLNDGGGLYDPENADLMRHMRNSLTAREFYKKDHQYVVRDGEVVIVDEFTGRMMHGRRYSEGLHQAIEAKENVKIQNESRTYATITIQNYFRMYQKLAGMTGTAVTEAEEFHKIYKLEVVIVPTNKPQAREDFSDYIYKDVESKFKAVVQEVDEVRKTGRPVLIGTVSIEKSEYLGALLKRKGIKHEVLNAKQHEKEANIVAEAGKPGAVTVATNMAGRGVDIILGGKEPQDAESKEWQEWKERHDQVIELGGLHVVGTERHEARRIDNQLRGRAGRQGDPGSSRFFVSLEDDLMKRFGGDRIKGVMDTMGFDENTPIENKLISRSIENAQVRVEGYHFDIRKHLVDYDDVINKQREIIYGERHKIIDGADLKANILSIVEAEIKNIVEANCSGWDMEEAAASVLSELGTIMPLSADINAETLSQMSAEEMRDRLIEYSKELYDAKESEVGPENMRLLERLLMLRIIDTAWIEHLTAMDNMRQGIGLQSMAQRDPLVAYKRQSRDMFDDLMGSIQNSILRAIYKTTIKKGAPPPKPTNVMAKATGEDKESKTPKAPKVEGKVIGRNDPCPCGSGKKFKKCCGK
ncbi:MAG: preprotein translocase subunit SecA [Dehalococcoidales bacterium]